MISIRLPSDWSIHSRQDFWSLSQSGIFLGEALQRLGHLSHLGWVGLEPQWANHGRRPYLPEADDAFDEIGPIAAIYDAYATVVRDLLSPSRYLADRLHIKLRADIENGLGSDEQVKSQIREAELRVALGLDHHVPVTRAHWAHVWWECETINSELEGAERRLPSVVRDFLSLAQTGRLKTTARPVGGGDAISIGPEGWEVDVETALSRLATCTINPAAPTSTDNPPTHWIFVDQADIEREMLELEASWQRAQAECNQPLRTLAEGTINDCACWLIQQFENPSTREFTKEEFWKRATAHFKRSLSQRGFLDAWRAATPDYPERRISGPKRGEANSAH